MVPVTDEPRASVRASTKSSLDGVSIARAPSRKLPWSCCGGEPVIAVFVGRRVNRLREPGVTYRSQISDPGSGRRFTLTAR